MLTNSAQLQSRDLLHAGALYGTYDAFKFKVGHAWFCARDIWVPDVGGALHARVHIKSLCCSF